MASQRAGGMKVRTRKLPYKEIALLVAGIFLGFFADTLKNYMSASRSERFELEQQRRADVKVSREIIRDLLEAIDGQNEVAMQQAIDRLEVSTLYLPEYRSMTMPLLFAVLHMHSSESSYRLQSNDNPVNAAKLKAIKSEGWERISQEALDLKLKLISSTLNP